MALGKIFWCSELTTAVDDTEDCVLVGCACWALHDDTSNWSYFFILKFVCRRLVLPVHLLLMCNKASF